MTTIRRGCAIFTSPVIIGTPDSLSLMSLCDKGTGLLETHVQWEDVEEALSSSFAIPCAMGPNKSLVQIGEGKGFISRIALIDPDWLIPSPKLPNKFCICSQLPQVEYDETYARTEKMEELFKTLHNSEVDAYEIFEEYRTPELKVAKLFAARRFSLDNPSKGFLILPFFENLEDIHVMDNMTLGEVEQVLEAIVEMALVTQKLSGEQLAEFSNNVFSTDCGTYYTPTLIDKHMGSIAKYLESDHPELCSRLDEIKYDICSMDSFKELDGLCEKLGMSPLIIHRDLWSANVLWSKREEHHQLEAIVDYQSLALSTPAVDICSFICSALSGEDRLENTDYILEKYYSLLETKILIYGGRLPFTKEQVAHFKMSKLSMFPLRTSFVHIFPFHGFDILGGLMEIYDDMVTNPGRWSLQPDKEKVMEKGVRLVESILGYYEESKRLKSAQS